MRHRNSTEKTIESSGKKAERLAQEIGISENQLPALLAAIEKMRYFPEGPYHQYWRFIVVKEGELERSKLEDWEEQIFQLIQDKRCRLFIERYFEESYRGRAASKATAGARASSFQRWAEETQRAIEAEEQQIAMGKAMREEEHQQATRKNIISTLTIQ